MKTFLNSSIVASAFEEQAGLKDVSVVAPNGKPIEVGRGGLDIPSILKALIAIKFTGNVGFEYEKDAKDPVLGLAESVGYVRGVLKSL